MKAMFAALALFGLLAAVGCNGLGQPAGVEGTLLTVVAEGDVKAAPDVADVTLGVATEAQSARAAMQANAQRMAALIAALKSAGAAERDIQTASIFVHPQHVYGRGVAPRISGYQAANSVNVRVRNLGNLGAILDAAAAAGANTIHGLNFATDNPDAGLNEARKQATARARERAEVYAQAAGMRVRRIVSISEGDGVVAPAPLLARRMGLTEAAASAATPTERGELATRASVTVVFELR